MILEKKEKQMVELDVVVLKTCICDVCKKTIYTQRLNPDGTQAGKYITTQLYRVSTGHCDWGNDSVDSVDSYTICSPECLKSLMDEYYRQSFESNLTNTWWVDINHDYMPTLAEVSNET